MSSTGWIGVDLDGTLAHYDGWKGIDHIGEPVPAMVERVKRWLAEGKDVRIFTARVCVNSERGATEAEAARAYISSWSFRVFDVILPVTNIKDFGMVQLWDDRCVQVEPNTGEPVGYESQPCPLCGERALGTGTVDGRPAVMLCFACRTQIWSAGTAASAKG
jgi:hypothetical protein